MCGKAFHCPKLGYTVFKQLAKRQQLVSGAKHLQIGQVLFFVDEYCVNLCCHVSLKIGVEHIFIASEERPVPLRK